MCPPGRRADAESVFPVSLLARRIAVQARERDFGHSGTARTSSSRGLTTWMPHPCCWNDVDVASTPYPPQASKYHKPQQPSRSPAAPTVGAGRAPLVKINLSQAALPLEGVAE